MKKVIFGIMSLFLFMMTMTTAQASFNVDAKAGTYWTEKPSETGESIGLFSDDALERVPQPENPAWEIHDGSPGTIAFDYVPECEGEYYISVYKDGEDFYDVHYIQLFPEDGERLYVDFFRNIYESGTYTFSVSACGDEITTSNSEPVYAKEAYEYVRPQRSLDTPQNPHWDEQYRTCARWDEILNREYLYSYDTSIFSILNNGEQSDIGGIGELYQTNEAGVPIVDFLEWMTDSSAAYAFNVRSISKNIEAVANSDASLMSELYLINEVSQDVYNKISNLDGSSADEIKNTLKNIDKSDMAASIQTNDFVREEFEKLEDAYKSEKNINVSVDTDTYTDEFIDGNAIAVSGAAFNAQDGVNDMSLKFNRPDDSIVVDESQYKNIIQMDIQLNGAEPTGKLDVPVYITMPIPSGIDFSRLVMIHHHSDGSYGTIWPVKLNDDGTISFTLTSFSTFTFAEKNMPCEIESAYLDWNGIGAININADKLYQKASVYAALYDSEKRFLGVKKIAETLNEGRNDIEFDISDNDSIYSFYSFGIFVWDGIKPISCDYKGK